MEVTAEEAAGAAAEMLAVLKKALGINFALKKHLERWCTATLFFLAS